jgi:Zn-dependent protease
MLPLLAADPVALITRVIAILIALSVHEWAHAYAATRFGDPTPHNEGRLTLNPIAHLDPMGAFLFLVAGFGWAKPVPVNPAYFARPKSQMAAVAFAGPFSNLILAILSLVGLVLLHGGSASSVGALLDSPSSSPATVIAFNILSASLFINLGLGAFNLLPIAPLDGSKVLQLFIPWRHAPAYEDFLRVGPFILLFLVIAESFLPIRIIGLWINFWVNLGLGLFNAILSIL